jgi:hypothetical protein
MPVPLYCALPPGGRIAYAAMKMLLRYCFSMLKSEAAMLKRDEVYAIAARFRAVSFTPMPRCCQR